MSLRGRLRASLAWRRHRRRTDFLCREHPLQYLFMEVTRRCNLACAYCGSLCDGRERPDEMPVSRWVEIARQVAADFDPTKVMVAVTGGEPLLKEGVFDLFAELHRLGFPYGIVSNGQTLDRRTADRLVSAGVGSVSISMDAPPDLNDRLRGKGSSARVVEAVSNLCAAGYRGRLEIISTVTTPAVERLEDMRRFVSWLRVPLWRVAPVMPIGRAAQRPDLVPGPMQLRTMLEFVRQSRLDGLRPGPEFSEEGFLGNRFEGQVRPYLCRCGAGITIAGIRANGRIGACPELAECFDQGDIARDRLRDVWQSRYQVFRDRSWTRKGACSDCRQFTTCRGGSLHLYASTEADILRCLYLMCKETDGLEIPMPRASA